VVAALCIVLLISAVSDGMGRADKRLPSQEQAAARLIARFGPQARIMSINVPQAPALTGSVSPTRFIILHRAFDTFMDAREPGGFAGWLERMKEYDPQAVVFEPTNSGYADDLEAWLDEDYRSERIRPWLVYTQKP